MHDQVRALPEGGAGAKKKKEDRSQAIAEAGS
jgi:hypothetical protein